MEVPNEFQDYEHKAFMSLDGLIRPISMDGEGGLPRYASTISGCQKTNSAGMHPPVFKPNGLCTSSLSGDCVSGCFVVDPNSPELYKTVIDVNYLNPFSNPPGIGSRTGLSDRVIDPTGYLGHDIDLVGRGTGVPDSGMIMPVAGFDGSGGADYTEDYRMLGLRGPLLMQSWGYDLNGKPIPNYTDTELDASSGVFASTGLCDYFMDQWLKKSHTWPVAPVDLRFDRARGLWVSPPTHRLIRVELEQALPISGSATGIVLNGENLFDSTGVLIAGNLTGICSGPSGTTTGVIDGRPRVVITDVLDVALTANTKVLAYYDPYNCEYYPLVNAESSNEVTMIKFRLGHRLHNTDPVIPIQNGAAGITVLQPRGADAPNITGVLNTFKWDANYNAVAIAVRNFDTLISGDPGVAVGEGLPPESGWEGLQVECP